MFEGLLPGPRSMGAAQDVARLARSVCLEAFGSFVPEQVLTHHWSALNCAFMWAAAGDNHTHPVWEWLCRVLEAIAGEGNAS